MVLTIFVNTTICAKFTHEISLKMIIPNASQIRELDAFTIAHTPIKSIDLMEKAARQCFQKIKPILSKTMEVMVFCGPGNNGGDGLAIARMIAGAGFHTRVFYVGQPGHFSQDFETNLRRIEKFLMATISEIQEVKDLPAIDKHNTIIIDALLGTGLNRQVDGIFFDIIRHINNSGAKILSIDIPSGLFCDGNALQQNDAVIRANHTYTFQFPKLSFLFPENEEFVGNFTVLDIGLHPDGIRELKGHNILVENSLIKSFYRERSKFSHKGNYGHALLFAASEGKAGAAILAAEAAMRSGVGLLTAHVPKNVLPVLQARIPEAMCRKDDDPYIVTHSGEVSMFNAIAFGPGVGTDPRSANALKMLIQDTIHPLVIDADGLNLLAQNPTWLAFLPKGSILTPHPKEFERIAGKTQSGLHRLELAKDLARKFSIFIILKGAYTAVVCPDGRVFFNPTGNPGMATAGSGDVLTGMILAWLAKGYPPLQAALISVFLHGAAGDLAAARLGMEGMTARDIVFHLPKAAKKLFEQKD